MNRADKFNQSHFGCWINSKTGRIFRVTMGLIFLVLGITFHSTPLGVASLIWFIFPFTAGTLDVCYISAALGGPLSGKQIRKLQSKQAD